jgi:hypothetical protein
MGGKRWAEFTPKEKKEEFISVMQSNFWKYLPNQTQRNIRNLLSENSSPYSCR